MKIAIFTDSFLPQINGVSTVTANLAKHLGNRGHSVYILAPSHRGREEFSHPNVIVKRIVSVPGFFYTGFRLTPLVSRRTINYLRREGIDIIHFQTPITMGMQAIFASRALGVPLVGTYHTLIADPQYLRHIRFTSKLAQRFSWAYSRLYYNRCDLITCPSSQVSVELSEHGLGTDVISNGLDLSLIDNRKWRSIQHKYGRELLIYTGRIAHEKNLTYLLDCFALVRERRPNARLLMVGDGPQMHEIKAYVKGLGLGRSVIFTGSIPHRRLLSSGMLRAASVFVTASTTEVQCLSLMEAMASGTPAVAIGARGIRSLIAHGKTGYLIEEGEKAAFARAVVRLLEKPDLRARMGAAAKSALKRHAMPGIARTWEKRYQELIEAHA